MIVVLTGKPRALSTTNALTRSLALLKGPAWAPPVAYTGTPSFVTDALLAVRNLSRRAGKGDRDVPPTVVYPNIEHGSNAGLARPSALLTFLLTEREVGYPCIINAGVQRTTCTERLSRISPLTAVSDTIRIASGDHAPSGRGPAITVPTLDWENVDSLRNLAHHWIRPLDGLNLTGLLDQGFASFEAAFERWDSGSWYDRHHWRSFYALCLWFSHLPDPVPPRNDVQPGSVCWKQWGRLLGLLYDGRSSEAANVFDEHQQALKRCLRWI